MKGYLLIIFGTICFYSCSYPPTKDKANIKVEAEIEAGLQQLNPASYLSGQLLIGKKGSLAGISSLIIKGDRSYEFDERENITAIYDMSNNYSVYSYDEKNRLVKFEIKQHTPAETYHEILYKYSLSDSVVEIRKSHLKEGKMRINEVQREGITLDHIGLKALYFQRHDSVQLYLNEENREIITYKDDLIFCCGVQMKGKNKLSYYLNENGRFDSLVIMSLEEENRITFEYEYKETMP